MDNPRPEKVAVVDEVRGHFSTADAAILTEYRGLKVKDLAELRRSLRANGSDYRIYKNTLVRFATRELGLEDLDAMLVGPTAIAFVSGDAAATAKTLRDYSRTNNRLVIKGGVLGNKILSSADTAALAELPSREVLLARFAGGLAAPLQQFASLLAALPRNLAYGLAALRDQRLAGGEVAEAAARPRGGRRAEAAAPRPAAAEAACRPRPPSPRLRRAEPRRTRGGAAGAAAPRPWRPERPPRRGAASPKPPSPKPPSPKPPSPKPPTQAAAPDPASAEGDEPVTG